MGRIALGAFACMAGLAMSPANAQSVKPTSVEARLADLERRVLAQEDLEAIRRLQYAYNYYNTSGLHKQAMDLISENAESIEIGGRGVYLGKKGFVRAFGAYADGSQVRDRTIQFGRLLFQLASMDVITIAPDGKSAKARVAVLTPIFQGFPGKVRPRLNGGVYEMAYVKEGEKWLISKFKYVHIFNAVTDAAGNIVPDYSTAPDGTADKPTTWYHPWPETGVLPFSFPNPVTGEYPEDHVGQTQYWIGNWPGEFGKTGTKPVAPKKPDTGASGN